MTIDKLKLNGVDYTIVDSTVATQIQNGTANFFDGAVYDSNTKRINFYHGSTSDSGNIKAFIDASAFVKDGMVSNVEITGGNLVITFNTDAGKEAISIALTDIFNPANYYTKNEVDTALGGKQATLVSGTNIKTINGNSILGEGNLVIESGSQITVDSALSTTSENPVQNKVITTALGNKANSADLASVATSGSYNDLSNTPFVPTVTYDAQNTALVINTVAPAQS